MTDLLPPVAWHISSRCADTGASCVEAGPLRDDSGRIAIRHSAARDAATIVYGHTEWSTFIDALKRGQFAAGR